MVFFQGFRRFLRESPVRGNAVLYTGYAVLGTLVVQAAEQWKQQPFYLRRLAEVEQEEREEWELRRDGVGVNRNNLNPNGSDSSLGTSLIRKLSDVGFGGLGRRTTTKDDVEEEGRGAKATGREDNTESAQDVKNSLRSTSSDTAGEKTSTTSSSRERSLPYYIIPITYKNDYRFEVDLSRLVGMMAFSFFYNGPANALIYPWYHRFFGQNRVNLCLLFDQTFYMPFCAIPACWYINGVVRKWGFQVPTSKDIVEEGTRELHQEEGGGVLLVSGSLSSTSTLEQELIMSSTTAPSPKRTLSEAITETTNELMECWLGNVATTMMIWIPAESLNLRFTPVPLRAVVAGTTSFFWLTSMAVWTHVLN